jgi:acyl-CoA reductase-like NAD-dependent aldehyde dehydrogenase
MAAGGLQRQLAQQALDAQRQTQLQQAYEPYQRAEFLKNIYAAGPTSQSTITQTSTPMATGNPLAQAAGAGLGAYATYSMLNKPVTPTVTR